MLEANLLPEDGSVFCEIEYDLLLACVNCFCPLGLSLNTVSTVAWSPFTSVHSRMPPTLATVR